MALKLFVGESERAEARPTIGDPDAANQNGITSLNEIERFWS
jgi:hypothetical protein